MTVLVFDGFFCGVGCGVQQAVRHSSRVRKNSGSHAPWVALPPPLLKEERAWFREGCSVRARVLQPEQSGVRVRRWKRMRLWSELSSRDSDCAAAWWSSRRLRSVNWTASARRWLVASSGHSVLICLLPARPLRTCPRLCGCPARMIVRRWPSSGLGCQRRSDPSACVRSSRLCRRSRTCPAGARTAAARGCERRVMRRRRERARRRTRQRRASLVGPSRLPHRACCCPCTRLPSALLRVVERLSCRGGMRSDSSGAALCCSLLRL